VRITPRFAFFTILTFIAAIGLPGTAGFIAELHTLIGGFERWGWIVIMLTLGVLISAAYAIRTIGRLFTGPVHCDMKRVPDLKTGEMFTVSLLTLGFISLGFFPGPTLNLMTVSIHELSLLFVPLM